MKTIELYITIKMGGPYWYIIIQGIDNINPPYKNHYTPGVSISQLISISKIEAEFLIKHINKPWTEKEIVGFKNCKN